jgi:hypothetical protein
MAGTTFSFVKIGFNKRKLSTGCLNFKQFILGGVYSDGYHKYNIIAQLICRLPIDVSKTDSWLCFSCRLLQLTAIDTSNPVAGFTSSDWVLRIFDAII